MNHPIRTFALNGAVYHHIMREDDCIELQDAKGNTILEFDASCNISNKDGRIGNFNMEGEINDPKWTAYMQPNRDRIRFDFKGPEALLDAEVEISKRYLMRNHMVEVINVGDYVRSYDFEDMTDCYIEGTVEEIVEMEGCRRYKIRVLRSCRAGALATHPRNLHVYPPVNGTRSWLGRITNGVKLLSSANLLCGSEGGEID